MFACAPSKVHGGFMNTEIFVGIYCSDGKCVKLVFYINRWVITSISLVLLGLNTF